MRDAKYPSIRIVGATSPSQDGHARHRERGDHHEDAKKVHELVHNVRHVTRTQFRMKVALESLGEADERIENDEGTRVTNTGTVTGTVYPGCRVGRAIICRPVKYAIGYELPHPSPSVPSFARRSPLPSLEFVGRRAARAPRLAGHRRLRLESEGRLESHSASVAGPG